MRLGTARASEVPLVGLRGGWGARLMNYCFLPMETSKPQITSSGTKRRAVDPTSDSDSELGDNFPRFFIIQGNDSLSL